MRVRGSPSRFLDPSYKVGIMRQEAMERPELGQGWVWAWVVGGVAVPPSSPTQSLLPLRWTMAITSSQASLPRPRPPINPPTCASLLPEGLFSQGGEPLSAKG